MVDLDKKIILEGIDSQAVIGGKIIAIFRKSGVIEIGYKDKSTGECKLNTYHEINKKYKKILTQTAEKGSDLYTELMR